MTNTYKVIIVDPSVYSVETDVGDDQYDLYALWERGDMPDGVWLETWTVPDGMEWDSHPSLATHHLCHHNCYLVDWAEIQEPWNVKPKSWWKDKEFLLHSIEEAQVKLELLAEKHMDEVVEVLGIDAEDFVEYKGNNMERTTDSMLTGFVLHHVNAVITDIQGDEIVVE